MARERSQQITDSERRLTGRTGLAGTLFVVGVPIGNPEDITLRALRVLREADLIASETPLATRALLAQHEIETPVTSYGPRHLKEKIGVLLHRLERGTNVALVSDCGTPVVSDPGCLLVAGAHARRIPVRSVPGPSALTAAVAVSGASGDTLLCCSLPDTRTAIRRCVRGLLDRPETIVAFCTPASLGIGLECIAGKTPRRRVVIACDVTTERERIVGGTAQRLRANWRTADALTLVTLILPGGGASGRRAARR